jgi:3-dehydroquinate dehydratase II
VTDVDDSGNARARDLLVLLSGPNLALLGERQPEIYGRETLAQHVAVAVDTAGELSLIVEHHQSDHEGELVELVASARGRAAAIVVNAGALSHYSWALHDALASFDGVVVELHLSDPRAREPWRQTSVIAPAADGTISGFGGAGYKLAVMAVAELLGNRSGIPDGAPRGLPGRSRLVTDSTDRRRSAP